MITGTTRLLAIIGDPIAQVRSPEVINPKLPPGAIFIPLHVPAARFEAAMPGIMALANLDGLVLTLPFKERAMAFADEILTTGRQVGAVNVMRRRADGTWVADMFDGWGLTRALIDLGVGLAGASVLLLGAGGAGSAIASSLAQSAVSALRIFDIDAARAEKLADSVRRYQPGVDVATVSAPKAAGFDVLVNATPVGMYPGDGLPAPLGPFAPGTVVFDIVPKPDVTPLMQAAADAGCKVGGGKLMVAGQADALIEFLGYGPKSAAAG